MIESEKVPWFLGGGASFCGRRLLARSCLSIYLSNSLRDPLLQPSLWFSQTCLWVCLSCCVQDREWQKPLSRLLAGRSSSDCRSSRPSFLLCWLLSCWPIDCWPSHLDAWCLWSIPPYRINSRNVDESY